MTAPARKNSCRRTSSSAAEACCSDVELIEHDLRCRQLVRHGVDVQGTMHVRTDRIDRGALPGIEARRQQRQAVLPSTVFGPAEDRYTVTRSDKHRVELLRLAAVNLRVRAACGDDGGDGGRVTRAGRVLCAWLSPN